MSGRKYTDTNDWKPKRSPVTDPMTPTEQDKELLDSLNRLGFKQGNDSTWWADDWQYDVTVEVNEHLALITADRKRVALEEWELAKEAVLKNVHVISDEEERLEALALVDARSYNAKIGSHMDKAFGFDIAFQPFAEARSKRIAELLKKLGIKS